MSALGQKQTCGQFIAMSALPPKADIDRRDWDVRFVPKGDVSARYCRRHFLLTLALWRHHNRSAGDRHLGQSERRLWLGRHFRRWRVQDGRPEPRIEGVTAAVPIGTGGCPLHSR